MKRFPLARFATLALAAFALLVLPWPPLRAGIAAAFRGLAGASFALAGLGKRVEFRPLAARVVSRSSGEYWDVPCDEFVVGFLPLAVFLALLAATPLPWRARLRDLALGAALVWGYVLVRIAVLLWLGYADHSKSCGGVHRGAVDTTPGSWSARMLGALTTFHLEPMVYFTIPLLLWALVVLRSRERRARLLGALRGAPAA
jgi:hypothetical protein